MSQIKCPVLQEQTLEHQFVTPFATRKYRGVDDLNAGLKKVLSNIQKTEPNHSSGKSTVGGYHTNTDLFQRNDEPIVVLRNMVGEAIQDFLTEFIKSNCSEPPEKPQLRVWGWSVILRQGDCNVSHIHPDAKLSGVYYVQIPMQKVAKRREEEGAIVFSDPRPGAVMNPVPNQIGDIVVSPEEGLMVLFPAYYQHAVLPFRTPGERICIAFNATF